MDRRGKGALYAVYAAVFLVMLALSILTPMLADDYSYCFSWADVSRIRSLGQIVPSMAVHREVTNGRVFTHGLVQLLLIRPKLPFDLLNALMAALLLRLFERHFPALSASRRAFLLAVAALLLWNLTPAFGQVFLWLDGAVNYGWGVVLCLLFLRPYARLWLEGGGGRAPWTVPFFLLAAFLAGSWSESGAPAAMFMALCLLLLSARRERRLDPVLLLGLLFALAGFVFLMSAPATASRASSGFSPAALLTNVKAVLLLAKEHLLPLYLLWALSFAAVLGRGARRGRLILSAVYVLGGLCTLAAYCFAAYCTPRHFCFAVCFTVLAELLLLGELLETGAALLPRLTAAALAVLFLFQFPLGVLDIGVTWKHEREREAVIRTALERGEKEVTLEIFLPATPYSAPYGLVDLYEEPDVWPNYSLAEYYGLDAVRGVYPDGAGR